ncbi:DUF2141 domain-containing protein [Lacimicrobium alkaliphilum]|uniref:DUF2141 domain-containing protein n=1 Tax=Lacimicrobium alkaliphilum TaxID=1526571 RepID=A0A0U3AX43_9ALTE|nr:DUF2141 domain-containing protein [Lacimicrobium alkaliphilum]ALS97560.1 hypothetical protein AT746_04260 [Lacimicrobium alkaliphilum]
MLILPTVTAQELTVRVSQIETSRQGQMMVMLFGKAGFPKDHSKALSIQTQPVETGVDNMEFRFTHAPVVFAVKVLHDEDLNGKVTKNWTGIWPAEGLGFSNAARVSLTGPPSFKQARLTRSDTSNAIDIPLIYP